jgi:hypothetical protein
MGAHKGTLDDVGLLHCVTCTCAMSLPTRQVQPCAITLHQNELTGHNTQTGRSRSMLDYRTGTPILV